MADNAVTTARPALQGISNLSVSMIRDNADTMPAIRNTVAPNMEREKLI